MISCQNLLVELSDYLDGELDCALRQELEFHLKACPQCCVIVDTTRKTIEIFRDNQPYPMPEDAKARLAAAFMFLRTPKSYKSCWFCPSRPGCP